MPKFKSSVTGVVSVNTGATFAVEEGKQIESDDPAVVEALRANPDLSEVKSKKK